MLRYMPFSIDIVLHMRSACLLTFLFSYPHAVPCDVMCCAVWGSASALTLPADRPHITHSKVCGFSTCLRYSSDC